MTGDEFQIHMFIESAYSKMSKIATELLWTENPTMQKLKVKVKETEYSTWYSQKKEYRKMANLKKRSIVCHATARHTQSLYAVAPSASVEEGIIERSSVNKVWLSKATLDLSALT